ncbi:MAG TPA: hypothetical protein VFN47_08935 [Pedococcus sp.]|nr:hypothetical protein [Pedococcus sp.]
MYSWAFVLALLAACAVLAVGGAIGPEAHRGAFTGLAILFGFGSLAALGLLVAIERRRQQGSLRPGRRSTHG